MQLQKKKKIQMISKTSRTKGIDSLNVDIFLSSRDLTAFKSIDIGRRINSVVTLVVEELIE